MDYKPTEKEKKKVSGPSYEERFDSILTKYYDDKKTWWDAVGDLLKKDAKKVMSCTLALLIKHVYTGLVGYSLNIEACTQACRLLISRKRKARS